MVWDESNFYSNFYKFDCAYYGINNLTRFLDLEVIMSLENYKNGKIQKIKF